MRTLVKYCLTGHLVLLSYVLLCSCCVFMDSCFTHVQHVHNYCILFVQRVDRERELIIAVSLPLSRTSVWLWSNSVLCKKKKSVSVFVSFVKYGFALVLLTSVTSVTKGSLVNLLSESTSLSRCRLSWLNFWLSFSFHQSPGQKNKQRWGLVYGHYPPS